MNLLNSFGFELPTRIEYGPGIVRKLPQIAARLNLQRIVLVADPGVTAAGLLKPVCDHLEKAGIA